MFPEDLLRLRFFQACTLIILIACDVLLQSFTKYLLSFISVQEPDLGTGIQPCSKQMWLLTWKSLEINGEPTEVNR